MLGKQEFGAVSTDRDVQKGDSFADARRQYTLKGVESEAIDLMRLAADAQGMKIGHWVSDRLKEAAKRALADAEKQKEVMEAVVGGCEKSQLRTLALVDGSMGRAELEERVRRLELEIQDLLKSQRDMLQLVLGRLV